MRGASYATVIDMDTVTISPKFQVVIPLAVRERLNLRAGTKMLVVAFNGGLRLMPLRSAAELRGIARGISTDVPRDADRRL